MLQSASITPAAMLDLMEKFLDEKFELALIEPYPDRLKTLIDTDSDKHVCLFEKRVQGIDPQLFASLIAGDLLFIDSSHIVKYNSDLHIIFCFMFFQCCHLA